MKKFIFGSVLSLSLLASPAFTHAAGLTNPQIQAILSVLQSFGADATTIANVKAALTGSTQPLPTVSLTQSATLTTSDGTTGQPFNVSWQSANATSCLVQKTAADGTLFSSWGTGTSGSKPEAMPYKIGTHHWWVDCTGPGGAAHADMYHTVAAVGTSTTTPSVTVLINGKTGDTVSPGSRATIAWNSSNTKYCQISNINSPSEYSATQGSYSAQFSNTTTFVASCTNTLGGPTVATAQATLTMAMPTVTFAQSLSSTTASGTTGNAFTVTWGSKDATSCVVQKTTPDGILTNPWATGTSGSKDASPYKIGMHHWWIDCTGPGGTVHSEFNHTVTAQ